MDATQEILAKLERVWLDGFAIIAATVNTVLKSKGCKQVKAIKPPKDMTLDKLATRFRRLWDNLPEDWDLPEIKPFAFEPWHVGSISVSDEFHLREFLANPGMQSEAPDWYLRNVAKPLEDLRESWAEWFKATRKTRTDIRTQLRPPNERRKTGQGRTESPASKQIVRDLRTKLRYFKGDHNKAITEVALLHGKSKHCIRQHYSRKIKAS